MSLLSQVAPDIRTTVNTLTGTLSLLRESLLDEVLLNLVANAEASTHQLFSLLGDIVSYDALQQGEIELNPSQVYLADLIRGVAISLQTEAANRSVVIESSCAESLSERVWMDQLKLNRALDAILRYAIVISRPGTIKLTAKPLPNDHCLICVEDNSLGLTAAEQAKLFSLSQWHEGVSPQRSQVTAALQLGLGLSQAMISLMGGELSVDSKLGQGIAWRVILPLTDASMAVGFERKDSGSTVPNALSGLNREQSGRAQEVQPLRDSQGARGAQQADSYQENRQQAEVTGSSDDRATANQATSGALKASEASPEQADKHAVARQEYQPRPVTAKILPRRYDILLVDDNQANRAVLTSVLSSVGHDVAVASNGLEAVSACRVKRYDLVIMDLAMPEMDGLTAARNIRKLAKPNGVVPMCALTAYVSAEDRNACLSAGYNGYLTKPVTNADLLAAVQSFSPSAAAKPQGAVQLEHLSDMSRLMGADKLAALLSQFKTELEERIYFINASDDASSAEVRRSLYIICRSAETFGFLDLANKAKSLGDSLISDLALHVDVAKAAIESVDASLGTSSVEYRDELQQELAEQVTAVCEFLDEYLRSNS